MAAVRHSIALPDIHLIESDGEPFDSSWHREAMMVLIEQVRYHLRDRQDYFVGGNMFIYFSLEQARKLDYRGPDFFYVKGVRWEPLRPYWVVWEEAGRYPNVIIELLSPSTEAKDKQLEAKEQELEAERQHAEAERRRAEAAEAELARLKQERQ